LLSALNHLPALRNTVPFLGTVPQGCARPAQKQEKRSVPPSGTAGKEPMKSATDPARTFKSGIKPPHSK